MPGNNRNRRNNRNRKKRNNMDFTLIHSSFCACIHSWLWTYNDLQHKLLHSAVEEGDPEFYFRKQLIFTIIGFALMIVETKILDYHYLKKLAVEYI